MDWYLLTRSTCRRSSLGATWKHGQQFKHTHTQYLQFTTFHRFRWRFHLLFIDRPQKQVNHSFPCHPLVGLNQIKEPRSENVHPSRRIVPNLFIRKSKTGLNELSNIFACTTVKTAVQIEMRIVFFTYMLERTCRNNDFFVVDSDCLRSIQYKPSRKLVTSIRIYFLKSN